MYTRNKADKTVVIQALPISRQNVNTTSIDMHITLRNVYVSRNGSQKSDDKVSC